MNTTDANNARYSSELSEKHADKVIAYVAKMLAEDVKKELHDAQMEVITIKDMERALQYIDTKMRHKQATNLPRIKT